MKKAWALLLVAAVVSGCGKSEGIDAPTALDASPFRPAKPAPTKCYEDLNGLKAQTLDFVAKGNSTMASYVLSECEKAAAGNAAENAPFRTLTQELRAEIERKKAEEAIAAAKLDVQRQWQYTAEKDAMTDGETNFASIQSQNSLALKFPYDGENHATIFIRQHPKHGLDVMFKMDKGQLLCSPYRGCELTVRFDDEKPIRFQGTESADLSRDTVFINDTKRFIERAKKARKILIQAHMYNAGEQILHFSTLDSLVWNPGR